MLEADAFVPLDWICDTIAAGAGSASVVMLVDCCRELYNADGAAAAAGPSVDRVLVSRYESARCSCCLHASSSSACDPVDARLIGSSALL